MCVVVVGFVKFLKDASRTEKRVNSSDFLLLMLFSLQTREIDTYVYLN